MRQSVMHDLLQHSVRYGRLDDRAKYLARALARAAICYWIAWYADPIGDALLMGYFVGATWKD
jgi:hypothetical protein